MNSKLMKVYLLLTIAGFFVLSIVVPASRVCAQSGNWETKAPMPIPVGGNAVGVINDILYSVAGGGCGDSIGAPRAPTLAYDPTSNTWTTKTRMPVPRKNLAGGVVNGLIYVIGGDNDFDYLAANDVYDPATDTWTTKTPMPTPRTFPAVGVVGGILYVIGGASSAGLHSQVEAYDPASDSWTTRAPMPTPRLGLGVGIVNGIIYAIGGRDNSGGQVGTVEAYDPVTNSWMRKALMPTPRESLGVGVINGIIYAIGGATNWSTVEAYDPASDTWSTRSALPVPAQPVVVVANDTLYAVGGGVTCSTQGTVQAFTTGAAENTPPVAVCHNVTVQAGLSCAANASIDNGSSDPDSGDTITLRQLPSGPYALGTTLVSLTVTDNHGASSSCDATVTVVDNTTPIITCPASFSVTANLGSGGAAASYPAPMASDNCSTVNVACSPPSGSSFPVGTTTVTCTATDSSGNSASCSFGVTVLSPQQATQSLVNNVNALVSQGVLNQGEGNALTSKLQAATQQMNNGNRTAARNQLQAFINQVNALMNSGRLTSAQGQALIDAANSLIAHIP